MKSTLRALLTFVALSAFLLLPVLPAHAGVMGVQMFVNGRLIGTETFVPDPDGAVPVAFDAAGANFQIDGNALLDVDPFIDYSFTVLNFTENALEFSLVFVSPYTGGPFDTLTSEFSSTVTDADGNGGAGVLPSDASGFMAIPQIDGTNVLAAALGTGCTPEMTPGSTVVCDPLASTSTSVATLADGFFGVTVGFFLSGGDSMTGQGRVELLAVDVPEPASLILLGFGALTVLGRRSLSRYRR